MDFELNEQTIKDSYYETNQEGIIDLQSLGPTALECKLLTKMDFNSLVQISISRNYIGNEGVRYLIQSQWLYLRYLDIRMSTKNLDWNYISLSGIKLLSRGNWQQLIGLFVNGNQFGLNGCRYLIKGKWPKLRQIGLSRYDPMKLQLLVLHNKKIRIRYKNQQQVQQSLLGFLFSCLYSFDFITFDLLMQNNSYHPELNCVIQNINEYLGEHDITDVIQVEIKYSHLKKSENQANFNSYLSKSLLRPIILNECKDHRKHKINAKGSQEEFRNIVANLQEIKKKTKFQEKRQTLLYINNGQEKYRFNYQEQEWNKIDKQKLFQRQYDVISKQAIFRVDMCRKIVETKKVEEKLHELIKNIKFWKGVLRYINLNQSLIHEHYQIYMSQIYETENEDAYFNLKRIILENPQKLKQHIVESIKANKQRIRYEMELRLTEEGIDYIKKCTLQQFKHFFSDIFVFFRDLSKKIPQQSIVQMMRRLNICEEKQKEQKEQKQQKQQEQQKQEQKQKQK